MLSFKYTHKHMDVYSIGPLLDGGYNKWTAIITILSESLLLPHKHPFAKCENICSDGMMTIVYIECVCVSVPPVYAIFRLPKPFSCSISRANAWLIFYCWQYRSRAGYIYDTLTHTHILLVQYNGENSVSITVERVRSNCRLKIDCFHSNDIELRIKSAKLCV